MKQVRIIAILLLCVFSFTISLAGRVKPDSLYRAYLSEKSDTAKAKLLNKISYLIRHDYPDSAIILVSKAIRILNPELSGRLLADCIRNKGVIYKDMGLPDSSLHYFNISKTLSEKIHYKDGIMFATYNSGIIYKRKGDYNKAIELYLATIKLADPEKNKATVADAYNSLANTYVALHNYDKAIEYYKESLKIKNGDPQTDPEETLINIGIAYFDKKDFKKAKEYFVEANKIFIKKNNQERLAFSKTTMAIIYLEEKNDFAAKKEMEEAVELYRKVNDKPGLSESLSNLGSIYIQIGVDNKKDPVMYQKALGFMNEAIQIGFETNNADNILIAYESQIDAHKLYGNYKEAFELKDKYHRFKDSIIDQKVQENSVEMEKKFETEKKQKEIEIQKAELEKVKAEQSKEKIQKIALSAGLLLTIIVLFIIVLGYKKIRRTNKIITEQKVEVEKQKDIIEEKQKEILDSIHYAKRIQRSLLPSERFIEKQIKK